MPTHKANRNVNEEIISRFIEQVAIVQNTVTESGVFTREFMMDDEGVIDADAVQFLNAYAQLMNAYAYYILGVGIGRIR